MGWTELRYFFHGVLFSCTGWPKAIRIRCLVWHILLSPFFPLLSDPSRLAGSFDIDKECGWGGVLQICHGHVVVLPPQQFKCTSGCDQMRSRSCDFVKWMLFIPVLDALGFYWWVGRKVAHVLAKESASVCVWLNLLQMHHTIHVEVIWQRWEGTAYFFFSWHMQWLVH